MNNRIFHYLEMAAKIAMSKDDNRNFILGACGVRSDGVIVSAFNSPTEMPNRKVHAEYRLSCKLDHGSTVYVARVRSDTGKFAMAKPCFDCNKVLTAKKVKRIYYTISDREFGILYP